MKVGIVLVCALIKMAELYCKLVNLKTLLWKKIVGVVATVGAVALIIKCVALINV